MSQEKLKFKDRVKLFFKRNMYAVVVSGSAFILAVALLATMLVRNKLIEKQNAQEGVHQENVQVENIEKAEASAPEPIIFSYPLKEYTLGETHSDTNMVYNETLNEWTTHLGVDFIAAEGSEVMAAYSGTVESVEYDTLKGTTIIIDHGEGLKSVYSSLSDNKIVGVGQTVAGGEVIGYTSNSASGESSLGAHLHFETILNGESVNPYDFIK